LYEGGRYWPEVTVGSVLVADEDDGSVLVPEEPVLAGSVLVEGDEDGSLLVEPLALELVGDELGSVAVGSLLGEPEVLGSDAIGSVEEALLAEGSVLPGLEAEPAGAGLPDPGAALAEGLAPLAVGAEDAGLETTGGWGVCARAGRPWPL